MKITSFPTTQKAQDLFSKKKKNQSECCKKKKKRKKKAKLFSNNDHIGFRDFFFHIARFYF